MSHWKIQVVQLLVLLNLLYEVTAVKDLFVKTDKGILNLLWKLVGNEDK